MRIAILTDRFPSVSETFVLHHAVDLLERGHEVEVYAERGDAEVVHPELRRHGLGERLRLPPPMPVARPARVRGAWRLLRNATPADAARLLHSVDPLRFGRQGASLTLLYRQVPFLGSAPYDVVHCHHGPVGLLATRLRRLSVLRGPLVTSFHGFDLNVAPRHGGPNLYAPLFRQASLLLVNSDFLGARALALGAPSRRLVRHPVGVDPASFRPARRVERPRARRQLLSVGRLVEAKGFDVALRAVARLAGRHPDLHYAIAGDGPQRGALQALAMRLGIGNRVRFEGAVDHGRVRALHAESDLFCLPSVPGRDGAEESQGLSLVEAQSSGLPVVASDLGGVPQSLRDGVTGHLVPPRDAEALARALSGLLDAPERRAAMGREGRRFVLRHFDRHRLADRLVSLYETLAGQPRRPQPEALSAGSAR